MTVQDAEGRAQGVGYVRPTRGVVITVLGVTQILAWGSSYYLLAVLAEPIARDTGWSLVWIVGALSLGLLVQGLAAPYVGDAIDRYGGRPVLAVSALLLAGGLVGLAVAPSLPLYVLAWVALGLGMSAGLYDAAFSTLGRLYGRDAKRSITLLTLFGGFASTVCWPLTALLSDEVGWRGACLVYAAIQLAVSLPVYWWLVPREIRRQSNASAGGVASMDLHAQRPHRRAIFLLLATTFAIGTSIATVMSVHLLTMLAARDITLAAAVGLGALIGPSQVGARVVELVIGRHHHPVWTMVVSAVCIATGLGLLWADLPAVALTLVLYGGGMGIKSIVRGALPLFVFGVEGYASLMGRLAMPAEIAGAAAPFLAAVVIEQYGADATFGVLTIAGLFNVGLVGLLLMLLRRWRSSDGH